EGGGGGWAGVLGAPPRGGPGAPGPGGRARREGRAEHEDGRAERGGPARRSGENDRRCGRRDECCSVERALETEPRQRDETDSERPCDAARGVPGEEAPYGASGPARGVSEQAR